jgi:hypothetical protein
MAVSAVDGPQAPGGCHYQGNTAGIGPAAAQAVFGTPIVLPGQFFDENANFDESDFYKNFSPRLGFFLHTGTPARTSGPYTL